MKPIYTFDIETDPFLHGRDPQPFVCGLYTGDKWFPFWGKDCIEQVHKLIADLPSAIIYAHNGGKFDMFYCMDWIANFKPISIIANRIVKAHLWRWIDPQLHDVSESCHEFRDSYAIMPFALKKYKKDEIDYRTFEKRERNKPANKQKILRYLRNDCVYLHELVTGFVDRFGDNLTIGSTSMKQLRKLHNFDLLTPEEDRRIRAPYYYGGRVQCFEGGVVKPSNGEQITFYDLNQCYPYSMRNFNHPTSSPDAQHGNVITDRTYFVTAYGRNYGAFPLRTREGLRFDIPHGIFSVSIHEFNAAIETGMFECEDIIETIDFQTAGCFDKFVDKFHHLRRDAQLQGDKIGSQLYKYVGNSAYGKFSQSPDNYHDYLITDNKTRLNQNNDPDGWQPSAIVEFAGYILWKRSSGNSFRYNVATGASITGAARSLIIRALSHAQRPLYCDTDCIVCERLTDVHIDDTELGAWKIEKSGNQMAIGGRKLYALFNDTCPQCGGSKNHPIGVCKKSSERDTLFHPYGCVKMASKGSHINPHQVISVARGNTVTWKSDAPTFNFKEHTAKYISRNIKMTAK